MTIKVSEIEYIYHDDRVIIDNGSTYVFLNASVCFEINDMTVILQTGSFFHNGDYNMPTNQLSVDDESDNLIYDLDLLNQSEIEATEEFTKEYLLDIYDALNYVINEAQQEIDNEAQLFEKEVESNDNKYSYVLYQERELYFNDENGQERYRICSPQISIKYDSIDDAEAAVKLFKSKNDLAQIVDAYTAASYDDISL